MPTLQITRQGLSPTYAAQTRNYILGIMLWPQECDERIEFMRTCAAASAIDAAAAVPGAAQPELLRQAFEARRPDDFQEEIDRRVLLGTQVGEFYAKAWQDSVFDEPFSVKLTQKRMTTPERRALHPAVLGEKSLEAVLREFRPAATLWGGQYIMVREGKDDQLPCSPERIAEFLAMAEWVRVRLSTLDLRYRPQPLLPPETDLWRPPSWLKLPTWRLEKLP